MMNKKRIIAVVCALALMMVSIGTDLKKKQAENLSQSLVANPFEDLWMSSMTESVIQGLDPENRIAVLRIKGTIQETNADTFGQATGYDHQTFLNNLKKIEEDPTVKGVLLAIDSPGGYVYHSAEAHQRVLEFKERTGIPVYTSMGHLCASGGYYIAAATDKLFASKDTVTGSIGVISQYMNMEGLYEKLGIQTKVFKSGPYKDMGSAAREMTEEERALIQADIDEFYGRFVQVVADGRKMTVDQVKALATGQTYTGFQASQNGLVDAIGYEEEALNALSEAIGAPDAEVFEYTSPMNWYQQMLSMTSPFGQSETGLLLSFYKENAHKQRAQYLYLYGDL